MSDTELLDFVEKHGIQIWPARRSKHGPIVVWWVQNATPFIQTYDRSTLRGALHKLAASMREEKTSTASS